jgi:hypothetical protein
MFLDVNVGFAARTCSITNSSTGERKWEFPLHAASRWLPLDAVKLLYAAYPPAITHYGSSFMTPLELAAFSGDCDKISYLHSQCPAVLERFEGTRVLNTLANNIFIFRKETAVYHSCVPALQLLHDLTNTPEGGRSGRIIVGQNREEDLSSFYTTGYALHTCIRELQDVVYIDGWVPPVGLRHCVNQEMRWFLGVVNSNDDRLLLAETTLGRVISHLQRKISKSPAGAHSETALLRDTLMSIQRLLLQLVSAKHKCFLYSLRELNYQIRKQALLLLFSRSTSCSSETVVDDVADEGGTEDIVGYQLEYTDRGTTTTTLLPLVATRPHCRLGNAGTAATNSAITTTNASAKVKAAAIASTIASAYTAINSFSYGSAGTDADVTRRPVTEQAVDKVRGAPLNRHRPTNTSSTTSSSVNIFTLLRDCGNNDLRRRIVMML